MIPSEFGGKPISQTFFRLGMYLDQALVKGFVDGEVNVKERYLEFAERNHLCFFFPPQSAPQILNPNTTFVIHGFELISESSGFSNLVLP